MKGISQRTAGIVFPTEGKHQKSKIKPLVDHVGLGFNSKPILKTQSAQKSKIKPEGLWLKYNWGEGLKMRLGL